MLLSRRFIENVLRRPGFSSRVLSIFIDEAHCISHWGDSFRKKYGSIGIVRAFLPKTVPIIAVSATLVPRVRKDIISKLQFDTHLYDFINVGNDRPNVAQIVRAAEYPLNSYRDLEFMVPTVMESPNDILKGFIYCDEIKAGNNITDYLNARVPLQYHNWGMVRPYNAAMSSEYRAQALLLFRAGVIRILVCTDAAGMVGSNSILNRTTPLLIAPSGLQYSRHKGCCAMEVACDSVIVGPKDGTCSTCY